MTISILAVAGSARKESVNKKLIRVACEHLGTLGVHFTELDLRQYELPIYDGDREESEGLPEKAVELKEIFKSHHGFLIASPEYNSSISPLLKNVIDWVSRPREGEAPLECFAGKTAALLAASPGMLGGLRGLVTVRSILGNIRVVMVPEQHALGAAGEAFTPDGKLKDEKQTLAVHGVVDSLVRATTLLHGER